MSLVHSELAQGFQGLGVRSKSLEIVKAYITLMKPRIAVLLLFTAYCAMIVAAGHVPSLGMTIVGLGGLGLSAGGAAAINMWFDRDIDAVMSRTKRRPLPTGLIPAPHALAFGLILGVASVVVLALWANPLSAMLSLAGYIYYGVIYTMCLKRHTPQNIVVGGGAGGFPPLVGWAVVTNHVGFVALAMFAVIFLWTPSHFWGLALYKNDDYVRAGVPMMPAVHGARTTKHQMVAYAVALLAASLVVASAVHASVLYTVIACVLGGWFLYINIRLLRSPDDRQDWAKKTFFASLLYLPAVFTAMVVCALL